MSEATLEKPLATGNGAKGAMQRSAFISAPPSVDTSAVRFALERKGVRCFSADQVDLPGESFLNIVREGLRQADLVIAVVDATAASNLVFLELGFAKALDKQIAVLLVDDASASPWLSSGVPYFRYRPEVPTTLDFSLVQILKMPHHGTKGTAPSRRTRSLGSRADQLLAQLRAGGESLQEAELASIIAEAIRESGVATVSQGDGPDPIDLAVWSDDLSPWVSNPLPVEVRRELRRAEAGATVAGFTRTMDRGGMSWGLLVYARADWDTTGWVAAPNILHIAADAFLEKLSTTSFGELIRGLRNQHVHGNP